MLIDYIKQNPQFVLKDQYCDEDLSGAGTYRPEFERLIKDCENGKIDIVLCKSQSRFSRDMEIVEKYINNKFKEWNVRFIGLTDNADTENAGNKKSRQITGLINEWYLEEVSQNIRSAFNSKMLQGEFISPFAAFGYEISPKDNNKLIIDPIASKVVKKIYELYINGVGFTKIANYLNSNKIPCPSLHKYRKGSKLNIISSRPRDAIKWNPNAIRNILTNEIYIGHLIQGKRTTISYKNHKIINKPQTEWIRRENTHEAIINKEIFFKVQSAIKERKKVLKANGVVHNFSGKVFCNECNHYMRKKNSLKNEYLSCSNNYNGYNDCENKSSIRYDALENLVLKKINEKIKEFYDYEILKVELKNKKEKNNNNHINMLKQEKTEKLKQITKIQKTLKKIYEDKINGLISLEYFQTIFNEYIVEEKQLNKELKSINEELNNFDHKTKSSIEEIKILKKYQKLDKINRIIIEEFIDKIYIGKINKDDNTRIIKIIWNF